MTLPSTRRLVIESSRSQGASTTGNAKKRITSRVLQGSSSSSIRSQAEYERRELAEAHKKLDKVNRLPIAVRKEAQAAFFEVMRSNPELVAERLGWLLAGSYGYGPMLLAKRVLASPRMNRAAALTQMVGVFEWQSRDDMSRAAWKKLSASEKARLSRAVQRAITRAESEE